MLYKYLTIVLVLSLSAVLVAGDVAVTVYNQDLALVRETRTQDFSKGLNNFDLTDVPVFIDATSVHFKLKGDDKGVELLEQNYQYDLISAEKILQRYLGHDIDVIMKNGDVLSGKYLSSSSGYLVLQLPDGAIRMVNSKEMLSVTAPKLPEGLVLVPTLKWLLDSDISGNRDFEVSYLTRNINWHAEYIALLDENDKNLRLSGWVSLDNRSGKTYKEAKLKLVAGDIHRVIPEFGAQDIMLAGMGDARRAKGGGFEEKAFFEYHLYTLGRKTTIANNETKQVALFEPASAPVEKIYRYNANAGNKKIGVVVSFKNSEISGLGMPLPKGKVRITKLDSDGSEEFVGEDMIDHTPKDEEVELQVGNAFDIVGETTILDSRRISERVREEIHEIKLRNHKDEDIIVVTRHHFWTDWRIVESNYEYTRKDARTAEFKIPVVKDGETVLKLTVRFGG